MKVMPRRKKPMRQEMDLTRDGTAEMTRWCIIIALHQCFGVGKDRLNRIEKRTEELGMQSLDVAMTANGKGCPSTDKSLAMRVRNWALYQITVSPESSAAGWDSGSRLNCTLDFSKLVPLIQRDTQRRSW